MPLKWGLDVYFLLEVAVFVFRVPRGLVGMDKGAVMGNQMRKLERGSKRGLTRGREISLKRMSPATYQQRAFLSPVISWLKQITTDSVLY